MAKLFDGICIKLKGRVINEREVERLLEDCKSQDTREAITMAFYEGMTLSEILSKIKLKRTTLQARLTKLSNRVLGFQIGFAKLRNSAVIHLLSKGYTAEYVNDFMGYSRKDMVSYRMRLAGYISPKLRLKVLIRDKFTCVYCGSNQKLEIDHIIPTSKGGKTVYENLQTLCNLCNRAKGNKEVKVI